VNELPAGTVTLLFSDVEGSTRLLVRIGDSFALALERHRTLLRDAFAPNGGLEVDANGEETFVVFLRERDAVCGAVAAQRALAAEP
jgi:class 3 adenylate cyclase